MVKELEEKLLARVSHGGRIMDEGKHIALLAAIAERRKADAFHRLAAALEQIIELAKEEDGR